MNKHHKTLEFDKIIEKLIKYCILDESKEILLNYNLEDDLELVRDMLEFTDEASTLILRLGRFSISFTSKIKHIISKTMKYGVITQEELMEFVRFNNTIKGLNGYVDDLKKNEIAAEHFMSYYDSIIPLKELFGKITKIINQFGEINDDASSELKEIRRRIKDTERNIQSKLAEIIANNTTKLSENIISIRNERYVIPVKNEYKNVIKGIMHDVSSSGETVFIEPISVFEMNNNLNRLYQSEKDEIYKIMKMISAEIGINGEELLNNYNLIVQLDITFSKADFGLTYNGKKTNVNKDGIVEMYQAYHPLLNVDNIVSNNILLGRTYKGIIITGPNTGGKTVLLKTVGLLSLMVKLGLLLPCNENSNINIFDDCFVDIGDEQSIAQNLSTFSSHMTNVIDILNNVNRNSLVLIDELGSGTDPVEGSSLAISIIDELLSKECLLITTSHYSELKIHAYSNNKVINASVEFDVETLKPTYKLLLGVPGQSNALKICKILGLSDKIIDKANVFAHNNDNDTNMILEKLVNQSRELDSRLNDLRAKENEFDQKLKDINKTFEDSIEKRNQMMYQAEVEAKKLIEDNQRKIDDLIKELEELKSTDIKQHQISNVKGKVRKIKEDAKVDTININQEIDFTSGMNVFVDSFKCYGVIVKKNKDNKYEVQIGNARMNVEKKYLKLVASNNAPKEKVISSPVKLEVKKDISMTLDLRGKRYEEAKDLIEKYIDDAIYAKLNQVSIIHGYGTGVIRELVHKTIKKYSRDIESSRYGGAGEGGLGVTVITFRK